MKQTFILIFLILPIIALAQSSGRVIYEETITFELPEEMKDKPEMQSFLANMPSSNTVEKELLFSGLETIYKNIEKEKATNEGSGFMFTYKEPANEYYLNTKTTEHVHMTDLFNKTFLISGEYEKMNWKLTKEQKMIGEYLCFKAITGDSTEQIEVWFTPQIITQAAPMFLNGLPGLILELTMNGGKFKLKAKDIVLGETKEEDIIKPSKGKKVTKEEYEKIVKKKTEEMKERYGKKGSMIFID